jgi:hypothetical protein
MENLNTKKSKIMLGVISLAIILNTWVAAQYVKKNGPNKNNISVDKLQCKDGRIGYAIIGINFDLGKSMHYVSCNEDGTKDYDKQMVIEDLIFPKK